MTLSPSGLEFRGCAVRHSSGKDGFCQMESCGSLLGKLEKVMGKLTLF